MNARTAPYLDLELVCRVLSFQGANTIVNYHRLLTTPGCDCSSGAS
jgi:hypothetical protein